MIPWENLGKKKGARKPEANDEKRNPQDGQTVQGVALPLEEGNKDPSAPDPATDGGTIQSQKNSSKGKEEHLNRPT